MLGTDEFKTLTAYDCFARGLSRSAKLNCLGHRPYDPVTKTWGKYQWQTWEEVARRRDAIGAGIVKLHENVNHSNLVAKSAILTVPSESQWKDETVLCRNLRQEQTRVGHHRHCLCISITCRRRSIRYAGCRLDRVHRQPLRSRDDRLLLGQDPNSSRWQIENAKAESPCVYG